MQALCGSALLETQVGDFEAHAWLECQGRILIGSQDVNRYEPLAGFEV